MSRGSSSKVMIYNVSKRLIKERKDKRLFGFKYPDSSDGYAHVEIGKDELKQSSNPDFYNVILSKYNDYRINYKKNDKYTSIGVSAEDVKKSFEASRTPKSNNKKKSSQRELPIQSDIENDTLTFEF